MENQDKPEQTEDVPAAEDEAPAGDEQAAPNVEAAEAAIDETAAEAVEQADDDVPAVPVAEETERDHEAELADANDKLLRALAEAENVRRRAARDVENATKRSIAGFAREMIVVADNLSRALGAIDPADAQGNEGLKGLLTGVEMTAREMQNAFERNGITKVDPLGEKFDPQLHEAMFEFEDASKPTGTIGQVMELGYSLHGQPIRPAKVGVTKGGPKEAPRQGPSEGPAPTPSEQVLNDTKSDAAAASGGNAYEDQGKPSGTNLDEEL